MFSLFNVFLIWGLKETKHLELEFQRAIFEVINSLE